MWQALAMGWGKRWLDTARHPMRRDRAILVILAALPWAIALDLMHRHHHLDAVGWTAVLTASLGLLTFWATYATFRDGKRSSADGSDLSTAKVADQLAVVLGEQWANEAAIRRLNVPYPLPVAWTAADKSLTDSWDSLMKLAASGAGWPLSVSAGAWAASPEELAGEGGELAEKLARVPTGRLAVLGEPGAGKTMLMVRLVLDLLTRRAAGGPVPFLVSVASWNPADQDLRSWLTDRLLIDHPALAARAGEMTGSTQAAALLASGLIMPILDGLDEIPEQVRGPAISCINDALRPGEQLVVTCRTQQYHDAIRPHCGAEVTLGATAAVQLCPLEADAVRGYLRDDAAGPVMRARWAPVLAVLGTEAPAGQALETPLMVGMARAIYNPRPGELAGGLRDPAELCGPALADREAVESLLFDAFIPAAYRAVPAGRWKAQAAEKWLVFLAHYLEQTICGPDLAWWQLRGPASRAASRFALRITRGPAFRMRIDMIALGPALVFGLVIGIFGSHRVALVIVLVFGPLLGGITAVSGDITAVMSPRAALARDRRTALLLIASFGFLVGIAGMLVLGAALRFAGTPRTHLVIALVFGLAVGFWVSAAQTAWPGYTLNKGRMALRHQLPWSLMSFLADAHQRGVLRQVGTVYQFRHIELQHRLAARATDGQPDS